MSQFEFFMTFYGLMLGLGIAELFGGFANILRERRLPRLGYVLPMLGVIALIEVMATFVDAWTTFADIEIALGQLVMPMLIGLCYFVIGVVMVPRHLEDWPDLDAYFDRRRRWIVGFFLVANLLIVASELPAIVALVEQEQWSPLLSYALRNLWLLGSYLLLLLSRRRWLDLTAAGLVLAFYTFNYILLRNEAILKFVAGN